MEINLLFKLIVAHLLTDFVFQPDSWVEDKKKNKAKSTKLMWHALLTAAVAYLISGLYGNIVIPLVIFITHYLIDLAKLYLKDSFRNFMLDQLAHLVVIILLWLGVEQNLDSISLWFQSLSAHPAFWLITAGYIFVSWPLGIIIGKATHKWRNQIALEQAKRNELANETLLTGEESGTKEEEPLGLASAGKWIGICERILILTFVLMQQYTAIGFLMTAKSILRFSEKETNTQLKTEYILVGTLVSFACSALVGVLIQVLMVP
ncbi:DUF3307 domain-containing protein [Pedobacter faecalis]|uniref:DUF3307 domain-containing protein n=1 Tax=Pedobacter faecalis TaxID=3041495 RepID=UPI00254FA2F8|nr:DUF3307 domain-containing protein [Pedobacter sp. ELA7]